MTKTFCDHCGAEIDPFRNIKFKFKDRTFNVAYQNREKPSPDLCHLCLSYAVLHGELPPLGVPPEVTP